MTSVARFKNGSSLDKFTTDDNQFIFDLDSEEICFIAQSQNYCVCFVDIVNSTKITAEINKHQKVGRYYSIFINTMAVLAKNYNAKIIKNTGDALIFYFPETSDRANEHVFREALECFTTMILARSIINAKLHLENLPSISYRISADYGIVEVAHSRTSKREDLFGSTMNKCAKINSMAEDNGIVIGGDLYQLITSFYFSNEYEFREVKGYSVGFLSSYPIYSLVSKNRSSLDRSSLNLFSSKVPAFGTAQTTSTQQKHFANILVVDDEPDILFTYKSVLSAEGYNIKAFTDPQEALKHFAQLPDPSSCFQLVILDIRMPRLNGLQLFYKIKALSPNTKIIFVSALDIAEELVSILPDVKYSDIIKKSLKKEHFVREINSAIKNSADHVDMLKNA